MWNIDIFNENVIWFNISWMKVETVRYNIPKISSTVNAYFDILRFNVMYTCSYSVLQGSQSLNSFTKTS